MDMCDNHAVLGEIRARHPTAMAKHRRLHPESRAAPAGAALGGRGFHPEVCGCRWPALTRGRPQDAGPPRMSRCALQLTGWLWPFRIPPKGPTGPACFRGRILRALLPFLFNATVTSATPEKRQSTADT